MFTFLLLFACVGGSSPDKSDTAATVDSEVGDTDTVVDSDTEVDTAEETAVDSEDSSVDSGCTTTERRLHDLDGDGYGDPNNYEQVKVCDDWEDGFVQWTDGRDDCNDADAAINPGATEVCNGIDDNCNHDVDGDAVDIVAWYIDSDGDGFGGMYLYHSCEQPSGTASVPGDCGDTNPAVNPGMVEICNGVDDDCNGVLDDDADETVPGARPYYRDQDVDFAGDVLDTDPQYVCSLDSEIEYADEKGLMTWISENDLDCVDTDSMIGPSVAEIPYDGIDQNCDHVDY